MPLEAGSGEQNTMTGLIQRVPVLRRLSYRPRIAAAAGLAVMVASGFGAGAAYAYFTGSSSGAGSGTTNTLAAVTAVSFQGGDAVTTPLLPGGTGDVIMRVLNSNSYPVTLVGVTAGAITSSDPSHCPVSGNFTFNGPTNLPITINAGPSSSQLIDLQGAASLSISAPSACQGVTFTIGTSSTPTTFQVEAG